MRTYSCVVIVWGSAVIGIPWLVTDDTDNPVTAVIISICGVLIMFSGLLMLKSAGSRPVDRA